jgi:hypothetical protein
MKLEFYITGIYLALCAGLSMRNLSPATTWPAAVLIVWFAWWMWRQA